MSSSISGGTPTTRQATTSRTTDVSGWKVFAAVTLLIAGGFNIANGLIAIDDSDLLVAKAMFGNLEAWGWAFVIWGGLQMLAGALSFGHSIAWSMLGVGLAVVACMFWFVMIFAAPFAALLGVILNIAVIYGLTVGAQEDGAF
jgi:hypothetical protein